MPLLTETQRRSSLETGSCLFLSTFTAFNPKRENCCVKEFCLKPVCWKELSLMTFVVASLAGCGSGGHSSSLASPAVQGHAAVQVSSPANNSTVGTTVNYVASATSTCASGVGSIAVFTAPNVLAFQGKGATLNTNVILKPGTYNTIVQATDNCGDVAATPVTITVSSASQASSPSGGGPPPPPSTPGNQFSNLHQKSGWTAYVLLPPSYSICSSCSANGPQTTLSMKQGVSSPSLSGNSTQFSIGGKTQFSDGLWNNHLIGDFSSQGKDDGSHSIVPATHNFVYAVDFYSDNISASQAVEFDINQFVDGKSYIWGHECRIAGGHEWDIWDNQGQKWHATGVACNPNNKAWNHLVIEAQRTSDGHVLFQSITLNGNKATLNYSESPTSTNWYGITINYQMDGNASQQGYSVWLDNLNFNYW